jgi:hypothetical protein
MSEEVESLLRWDVVEMETQPLYSTLRPINKGVKTIIVCVEKQETVMIVDGCDQKRAGRTDVPHRSVRRQLIYSVSAALNATHTEKKE